MGIPDAYGPANHLPRNRKLLVDGGQTVTAQYPCIIVGRVEILSLGIMWGEGWQHLGLCSFPCPKPASWGSSLCQFERTYPPPLGSLGIPGNCLVKLIPQRCGSVAAHWGLHSSPRSGGLGVRIVCKGTPFLGLAASTCWNTIGQSSFRWKQLVLGLPRLDALCG